MEVTRFASTNVLKALHDDLQAQPTGTVSARPIDATPAATADAGKASLGAVSSWKWVVPAGIAAAVVAAVTGLALLMGPSKPSQPERSQTTAPADSSSLAPPPSAAAAIAAPPSAARVDAPAPTASTPPAPTPPAPASKPAAVGRAGGALPSASSTPTNAPAGAKPPADAPKPTPAPALPPTPTAARGAIVEVAFSAAYPFEVFEGSRLISAASRSHELHEPNGKDPPRRGVGRVPGSIGARRRRVGTTDGVVAARARPAGYSRSARRLQDYGGQARSRIGPLQPVPAVAGDYQVSLACPDGQNPVMQTTVTQGFPARVLFTK